MSAGVNCSGSPAPLALVWYAGVTGRGGVDKGEKGGV